MAILKIIADDGDLDAPARRSTNATFFDLSRVDYGWFQNPNDIPIHCSWPEPAGNTIWLHFLLGQNSTSSAWDTVALEFFDVSGNLVAYMNITDSVNRWHLRADGVVSANYAASINAQRVVDVEITVNGTTDITMTVYNNGVLQGTLTRPNTANYGLPVSMKTRSDDIFNAGTFYFGECVIADEDTRGWRLRQHKPISLGGDSDWNNEVTAMVVDNLETGLVSNTLNDRTSFGLSNQPVPVGVVVDRVVLQTYAQRGPSGLASFNHYFKYSAGPTDVDDADIALIENVDMYIDEYPTSPDTGLAWTDTELNDIQFGIRART